MVSRLLEMLLEWGKGIRTVLVWAVFQFKSCSVTSTNRNTNCFHIAKMFKTICTTMEKIFYIFKLSLLCFKQTVENV